MKLLNCSKTYSISRKTSEANLHRITTFCLSLALVVCAQAEETEPNKTANAEMKKWISQSGIEVAKTNTLRCNCYIIRDKDNAVLVDTSIKGERRKLLKSIIHYTENQQCTLRCIVLTHNHFDHVGNAAFLSREFNCPILIHTTEAEELFVGHSSIPRGLKNPFKYLTLKISQLNNKGKVLPMQKFEKCEQNQVVGVEEGYSLSEFGINAKLIVSAGHTSGSVSVLIDNEIAIVGDAMVHSATGKIFPPFANNPELVKDSWRKLLDTGCKIFLPAHGNENTKDLVLKQLE